MQQASENGLHLSYPDIPVQDEEVIGHFNSLQDRLALEHPPVTAVRVVREPRTGKGRGIAYVELAARNAVSGALRLLQASSLSTTLPVRLGSG